MSPREGDSTCSCAGRRHVGYLPDASRPIRITPLERLSGDASNGDVARTTLPPTTPLPMSALRRPGAEECYVLYLAAKRKGATYQRILSLARASQDDRPVKAEVLISTSGKLIKSADLSTNSSP